MTYRRSRNIIRLSDRILIICEGEKTEPIYFKAIQAEKMRKDRLSGLRIEVLKTIKNTGKELVDEALKRKVEAARERNPYKEIWVVFDRDNYTKHPEAFDRAKATNINIAFSSTCFEFWLLLHFEYTTRPFSDCEDVIDKLKTYIPDYKKGANYYDNLLKSNVQFALERGNKIIAHCEQTANVPIWQFNPYTDVGKLVEKLLSL